MERSIRAAIPLRCAESGDGGRSPEGPPAASLPGGLEPVTCSPGQPSRIVLSPSGDPSGLEKFRFLAHRIEQVRLKRHFSSLLVTSPGRQEGKTVIAANLAVLLARRCRVLLIDCDLRRPGVGRLFGLAPRLGLSEFLAGADDLKPLLCRLDPFGLAYLPAGGRLDSPAELFRGPRVRHLLETARPLFDWIILDSSPVNLVAESVLLASICDGTLLVVREGVTRREDLEQAAATLEGSFLAGIVLNACDDPQGGKYYSFRSSMGAATEPGGGPDSAKS